MNENKEELEERKRDMRYSIIAGIIMVVVGIHGSAGGIINILVATVKEGFLPASIAITIAWIFIAIAFLGGISVIIGGILLNTQVPRFIATTLISIGSGVSIVNTVLEVAVLGPALRASMVSKQAIEALSLGFNALLLLVATILVIIVLVKDEKLFILAFIAGFALNLASSIFDIKVLAIALKKMGITNPSPILLQVVTVLFFAGSLIMLAGLLYGFKFYNIGIIVNLLGLILYLVPLLVIVLETIFDITSMLRLFIAVLGVVLSIFALFFGYKKYQEKSEQ